MYKQETGTRIVFEKKGDGVGEVTLPQLYITYEIQSDKMVFCYFFLYEILIFTLFFNFFNSYLFKLCTQCE